VSTMSIRPVPMYVRDAIFEPRPDGSLIVRMPEPLEPYLHRMTERLEHWAAVAPDPYPLSLTAAAPGRVIGRERPCVPLQRKARRSRISRNAFWIDLVP
jgi:hypothetical protein